METLGIEFNSVYETFKNEIYSDGRRYITTLPFKPHHKPILDNFILSKHRLHSLRNKLDGDPDLKREFHEILQDYIEKGIIEKVGNKGYQEKLIICPTDQSCDTTKKQQKFSLLSMAQQRSNNVYFK